jgi:predicted RNA-binding Zn-ribbon protein involved in translation (DUF1610 family)
MNLLKFFSGEKEKYAPPICPYCGYDLPKFPARKLKCPSCKKYILVRTRPSDRVRILIREDQVDEIEKQWQEHHADKDFKDRLSNFPGYTERKYSQAKENLTKKFGFAPKEGDVLWGLSMSLLVEAMKSNDWQAMASIYFHQGLFLHYEGKDSYQVLYQKAKCDLMNYSKNEFVTKVQILGCGEQSCAACREVSNRILTIKEALREMPIPVKDCSHALESRAKYGWCRCSYLPVID